MQLSFFLFICFKIELTLFICLWSGQMSISNATCRTHLHAE